MKVCIQYNNHIWFVQIVLHVQIVTLLQKRLNITYVVVEKNLFYSVTTKRNIRMTGHFANTQKSTRYTIRILITQP